MHYKQNNKEGRSYLQGLRPFKSSMPKSLKKILNKRGYLYSEIIGKWNNLVGDEIAKFSFPKSISMSKGSTGGKTLLISVKRGNEIEIEYLKKQIIDRINSYFGYNLIGEIRLETFSSSDKNNLEKKKYFLKNDTEKFITQIKKIDNKKIKDALYNLLKMIKK